MQYVFAAIAIVAFIRSCVDAFNSIAPMSCVATASAASVIFGRRARQLSNKNKRTKHLNYVHSNPYIQETS